MSTLMSRRGVFPFSRGIARGRPEASAVDECLRLRARDLEVLGWLGEQYAARSDQLEVLLGCGARTVGRMLVRLRHAGLVDVRRVLVGEPSWVIPTAAGLRACGLPFGVWRPRLGSLAHVAAVNDVRLHVMGRSPESVWVCERALAREREGPRRRHLVDALVLRDGRRIAIEVELTVKSRRRTVAILDELRAEYDAILYFCAPGAHRLLTDLAASGRWPSLGVRELPGHGHGSPVWR
jgi:hypothetical protein